MGCGASCEWQKVFWEHSMGSKTGSAAGTPKRRNRSAARASTDVDALQPSANMASGGGTRLATHSIRRARARLIINR